MNKALLGLGFGVISLLLVLAIVGKGKKEEVQVKIQPAMDSSMKAANKAKLQQLTLALRQLEAQKGGTPALSDLTEEALGSIPSEAFSGSKSIVGAYDGGGGWVYAEGVFSVNHPETAPKP